MSLLPFSNAPVKYPISIAHGGTGSATQNFVDLSSAQSAIGGNKTFTDSMVIQGTSGNDIFTIKKSNGFTSYKFDVNGNFLATSNNTYDIGGSSAYFLDGFISTLHVNSTASIGGGTAGVVALTGAATITSTSATALAVGANGTTNPQLTINASASSVATGVSITGAATGSGVAVAVTSSGTNEALTLNAKGTGTITIGGVSTGAITLSKSTQVLSAFTVNTTSSNAIAVGASGATNPALNVDASTASSATGLNIKSAAAGSGIALAAISSGTNEAISIDSKGSGGINIGTNSTGTVTIGNTSSPILFKDRITVTVAQSLALVVGANGATNPQFQVDSSTGSVATGLYVKGAAAGSGIALSAISSGTNENLTLDAKGSGTITLGSVSTGAVVFDQIAAHTKGTDTSSTATASAPTFVSGTSQQLNTTQDTMLYINVTGITTVTLAIGPTSTPATTLINGVTTPIGVLAAVRVPKGWYVEITGTIANLNINAVTC